MDDVGNRMENRFYVIEGTSCAGKTSVIRMLENAGNKIIPENSTLYEDFPPLPTNFQESRRNEGIILPIENQRCEMARSFDGIAVLDRMIASSLAISYAWNYGTINLFIDDVIKYIKDTGQTFISDCCFHLKVDYDSIVERNKIRKNFLGPRWVGKEVISRQNYFYDVYKDIMVSEKWVDINSVDNTTNQIFDIIENSKVMKKSVSIEQRVEEFIRLNEKL
ncbi:MAG: hypothetical protein E7282_11555 [Lachnospiraceae bacterium]|nr:hypothetical protein [Lachnospiraceae bacterium]